MITLSSWLPILELLACFFIILLILFSTSLAAIQKGWLFHIILLHNITPSMSAKFGALGYLSITWFECWLKWKVNGLTVAHPSWAHFLITPVLVGVVPAFPKEWMRATLISPFSIEVSVAVPCTHRVVRTHALNEWMDGYSEGKKKELEHVRADFSARVLKVFWGRKTTFFF